MITIHRSLAAYCTLLAVLILPGCNGVFEDNGTHLAFALEKGARALQHSDATESIVHYETLDNPDESYYVEITPSLGESATNVWSSYLVVSGKSSGGTSYHNRFLFVPKRLYIKKEQGFTELVLHKEGDRISVTQLR